MPSISGAMGWVKGLEPSISRATIWRLSQLGHTHHARGNSIELYEPSCKNFSKKSLKLVANVCPWYLDCRLCGAARLSCHSHLRCVSAPAAPLLLRYTHGVCYACTTAAPRPRYSCAALNIFPCSSSARRIMPRVKQ